MRWTASCASCGQEGKLEQRVTRASSFQQNAKDDEDENGAQNDIRDRAEDTLVGVVPQRFGNLRRTEARVSHEPGQPLSEEQIYHAKTANKEQAVAP